jgi:hypothetical protein
MHKPCPCPDCKGANPAHALLTMACEDSGDAFQVRVPHGARNDRAGWGSSPRVQWTGEDGALKHGIALTRGRAGVTARDEQGVEHRLDVGSFEDVAPRKPTVLRKAAAFLLRKARALKPGQRWITVHSDGEGGGTPILIEDNKDGTHSVIAGAGGKLQHLRLTNVKPKNAAEEKLAAADKRKKESERKAAQPKEIRQAEKEAKAGAQTRKVQAERDFVEAVRGKMGGVSEDLDQAKLAHLPSGTRNLILSRHHAKQIGEAKALVEEASKKLVAEKVGEAVEETAIKAKADEDPVLTAHARELASTELELNDQEDKERLQERRRATTRVTGGDAKVGEKATEKALAEIEKAPDPTEKLKQLGGRDDERPILVGDTAASEEVQRRSTQALHDAKILAKAAKGEEPATPTEKKVVAAALAKLEVPEGDPEAAKAALAGEAARRFRRAHVQEAKAQRFQEIEAENGPMAAHQALAYSDMLGGIAGSASAAKRMGLTTAERVPLKEHETAAMLDVLKSAATLRDAQKQFREMNRAAEAGDYTKARQAFDVDLNQADKVVALSVEDSVRRSLAEGLRGMASRERPAYMQSVASGQYDALADVGLAIGGQRYLDRPTVDAIGQANSATLLRWAMERDGHAPRDLQAAVEEHHATSTGKISTDALAKAEKYAPKLATTVEDVGDIEKAAAHLDLHEQDLDDAQRAVGSALGRMEATAALGESFRRKLPDTMEIHTGGDVGGTLQWMHAIGLTKKGEDYDIDYASKKVVIPKSAWGKLVNALPKEEVQKRTAARAIKAGAKDEAGWLPEGIVRRAASSFTDAAPASPRSWTPLKLDGEGDWKSNLQDHVGSRLADGEGPADVMSDLLSPKNINSAPDRDAYVAAVRATFPVLNEEGKQVKLDQHREHFQGLAESYMAKKYGTASGALHAQDIRPDAPETHEALFRALAEHPEAAHAFTPTGELDHQGQRSLRDYFYKRQGIDPKARADDERFRQEMVSLGPRPDPNKGTLSMFGGGGPSPEFRDWERRRDGLLQQYPRQSSKEAEALLGPNPDPDKLKALHEAAAAAPTAWERYVEAHGSLELGQRALQDELRGKFVESFREHHARAHGEGLKTGVAEVANRERHVLATAGEDELAKLRADAQASYAKLRARTGGQFAAEGEGAVKDKFTRHLEQETIDRQNQLGMFGARTIEPEGPPALRQPGKGERVTLGERAEGQIASLMPKLNEGFKAGGKIGLFAGLNMDGARVHQQRVIKMLGANGGRLGAYLGTGSGKSLVSIGAFTGEHAAGKATHGMYVVPAAVQEQFGAEMLRYTKPGAYRWATGSGKDHEARVAMLKDPDTHMKVMTHESFRDTMTRMMSDHHHGGDIEKTKAALAAGSPAERASMMRSTMDANGIKPWFFYGDEAHRFTHRGEGEAAGLHLVMGAAAHPDNASHALLGTATPVKNDESESYSMAAMLDPKSYGDRHQFLQNYGQNLATNPDAIRREMAHLVYTARVDPEGVDRTDTDNPRIKAGSGGLFGGGGPAKKIGTDGPLQLGDEHRKLVDGVDTLYQRVRKSREAGKVDVDAMRELSPGQFAGQPPEEHEKIARRLSDSVGIIRESALRRAVNQAPPAINTKLKALSEVVHHDINEATWRDREGREQRGKPSIVFTDSLAEAQMIHAHLTKQGIRAGLYHGGLNAKEREKVRLGFQPEGGGKPTHDVVVATSAAEAGINMQRAKVVHHFDVPMTEKSHAQRSGRAYRQGQQGDVDIHNWHTDADYEQNAIRRLKRKGDLAAVFQHPVEHLDEHGIAGIYNRILADKTQIREVA